MDNKRYVIDEIIEDVAKMEDMETHEIIHENLVFLPNEIHDGSVVIYDGLEYVLDEDTESIRREIIEDKMARLKALKEKKKIEEN